MKKKLFINGMLCIKCIKHIEEALIKVNEIVNVEIFFEEKTAIIKMNKNIDNSLLKKIISKAGYELVRIVNYENE